MSGRNNLSVATEISPGCHHTFEEAELVGRTRDQSINPGIPVTPGAPAEIIHHRGCG